MTPDNMVVRLGMMEHPMQEAFETDADYARRMHNRPKLARARLKVSTLKHFADMQDRMGKAFNSSW